MARDTNLKHTPSYQITDKGEKILLVLPFAGTLVLSAFFKGGMIYGFVLGVIITATIYIYKWKTPDGAFRKMIYYHQAPEILLGKFPKKREQIDIEYIEKNFNIELEKARNRLKRKRELDVIQYVDEIELLFKKHIKKKEVSELDKDFLNKLSQLLNQIIREENYTGLEENINKLQEGVEET